MIVAKITLAHVDMDHISVSKVSVSQINLAQLSWLIWTSLNRFGSCELGSSKAVPFETIRVPF